jgi:hypothetical protein
MANPLIIPTKLDSESIQAYYLFCQWLTFPGRRSIDRLYRAAKGRRTGRAPSSWRKLAREHRWNERAEEWDTERVKAYWLDYARQITKQEAIHVA